MSGEWGAMRAGSPGTLSPSERAAHHLAFALVAGSGLLLGWWKYLTPPSEDPFQVFAHPWLPQALHVHVLAAPLWVLAIGWILRDHIVGRWRLSVQRRGRYSGATAAILLLPMAGSGYLLQTAASEGWRRALVWVHVASGLGFLVGFVAHVVMGCFAPRRLHRHRPRADSAPSHE